MGSSFYLSNKVSLTKSIPRNRLTRLLHLTRLRMTFLRDMHRMISTSTRPLLPGGRPVSKQNLQGVREGRARVLNRAQILVLVLQVYWARRQLESCRSG